MISVHPEQQGQISYWPDSLRFILLKNDYFFSKQLPLYKVNYKISNLLHERSDLFVPDLGNYTITYKQHSRVSWESHLDTENICWDTLSITLRWKHLQWYHPLFSVVWICFLHWKVFICYRLANRRINLKNLPFKLKKGRHCDVGIRLPPTKWTVLSCRLGASLGVGLKQVLVSCSLHKCTPLPFTLGGFWVAALSGTGM